ncbi:hypothetical protein CF597_19400 [Pseudomonas sp. PSB1]|nr:hypothetical protein [Pseudomonas sp. PSB1]
MPAWKKRSGIRTHRIPRIPKTATNPCGSEPARDDGGSACINAECAGAIASRLAPTGISMSLNTTNPAKCRVCCISRMLTWQQRPQPCPAGHCACS